jgi:sulfotransferase
LNLSIFGGITVHSGVQYDAPEFDCRLNLKGLHTVRPKVELQSRQTILPPDLFTQFNQLSFWTNPSNGLVNLLASAPREATVKS